MAFLNTSSLTPTQKTLYYSTLFQLSNGSKELFHSNFLYWLSIVDWGVFVAVMRQLAGLPNGQIFWWEALHSPSQNNIKVQREHNHFDLSIFIFDGKKWLPVLVLENKVKSLPDYGQLARYEEKALDEWKRKPSAGNVTFILLSLVAPQPHYIQNADQHNPNNWIVRTYEDLASILKDVCLNTKYHQDILNDYVHFVEALDQMAQTEFVLNPNDSYIDIVCPYSKKGYNGDIVTELRLDDLRQKLLYAQLLNLVVKKLNKRGVHPEVNPSHRERTKMAASCGCNFLHNIGLAEFFFLYKNHLLGVQLQGNAYQHMIMSCDNKPSIQNVIGHLMNNQHDYDFFFEFSKPAKPCSKYPTVTDQTISNRLYSIVNPSFNCAAYKPYVVYQTAHIKDASITVNQVADAIVDDMMKIYAKLP